MDSDSKVIQLAQIRQLLMDMPSCMPGLSRSDESLSFLADGIHVSLELSTGALEFDDGMDDTACLARIHDVMVDLMASYHSERKNSILERARKSRNWKEG